MMIVMFTILAEVQLFFVEVDKFLVPLIEQLEILQTSHDVDVFPE